MALKSVHMITIKNSLGLITAWSNYQLLIQFLQKFRNRQIFLTCIGLVMLFMTLMEFIYEPKNGFRSYFYRCWSGILIITRMKYIVMAIFEQCSLDLTE